MPAQKLDKHSLKILNMEPTGITTNHSHQQLMSDSDSADVCSGNESKNLTVSLRNMSLRQWLTVAILCFVNLINYMDRFTVAGVLTEIQTYFNIGDDYGGLLQTAFVLSYMLFAPLFGYLGDRYSRRYIMAAGVFLWSLTTLLGSFMTSFTGFIIFRALVGIGEASYSTIAPTIISDLFVKDLRSKMLALFYFAIPVGSGLGYIVGSETASLAGTWQWGLRVTPIMGAIAVVLIIFVMVDPVRGESEGSEHLVATSYVDDVKELSKNASFMLSTFGFTCVAFVAGALAWWGPTFIHLGLKLQKGNENVSLNDVSYKFGILAMVSGLLGVPIGSFIAQSLREKYSKIDPIVCAVGVLSSAPFIYFAIVTSETNTSACYMFVFFGEFFLNLNWSIVADMLLYVVIPTRRSTAEAFQILLSHALGDAGSPYLIGVISEALKAITITNISQVGSSNVNETMLALRNSMEPDTETKFKSLQYALFITCFVEVLGGFFFLLTTMYILRDKMRVERIINEGLKRNLENSNTDSTVTQPSVSDTPAIN